MFSPIRASEVDAEAIDAHLIPEAFEYSNVTVESECLFDNEFGSHNDSRLIRISRNTVGDQKDVNAEIYDRDGKKMLHRTAIRTKSTIVRDETGVRKGVINFACVSEELKERTGLDIGSLVRISPYSPSPEDICRAGLSMLHSGFLTLYHHFGADYALNANAERLRGILLDSITDTLPSHVFDEGMLHYVESGIFVGWLQPQNCERLFKELLFVEKHPVILVRSRLFSCFAAVLPYHPDFMRVCILRGFGASGRQGYDRAFTFIGRPEAFPVKVVPWFPSMKLTAAEFWRREVDAA